MRSRIALAGLLLLSGTLIVAEPGCGMQRGETRATYVKGQPQLPMTTAPKDGDYALYTTTGMTPAVVRTLKKGDQLGFEKTEDGHIRAVAGDFSMILEPGVNRAYWKWYKK